MWTSHPENARTFRLNIIHWEHDFYPSEHPVSFNSAECMCIQSEAFLQILSSLSHKQKSPTTSQVNHIQTIREAHTGGFPKPMKFLKSNSPTTLPWPVSHELLPLPECIWKQAGTLPGEKTEEVLHDIHEKGVREQIGNQTRPIAA